MPSYPQLSKYKTDAINVVNEIESEVDTFIDELTDRHEKEVERLEDKIEELTDKIRELEAD